MNRKNISSKKGRKGSRGRSAQREYGGPVVPGGLDRVSRQTGKFMTSGLVTSSNHIEVGLSPFIDPRLSVLAAEFELYRYRWLKFTLFPSDNATNNEMAMGFVPDRPTALGFPTSIQEILELAQSLYIANKMIEPVWLVVKGAELLGRNALKWFDTDTTSSDSTVQGRLFVRTNQATVVVNLMVEYDIEFSNPIPATVTLARIDRWRSMGLFEREGAWKHVLALGAHPGGQCQATGAEGSDSEQSSTSNLPHLVCNKPPLKCNCRH